VGIAEQTAIDRRILVRLKAATAAAHARVDDLVGLDRMDRPRYRGLLAGLRDAHVVVEREIEPHAVALRSFGYDAAERSKLRWLDDDLATLGPPEDVLSETSSAGYRLVDPVSAFGAVYVVEGATLGGQVIARRVVPALSLTRPTGCRYFQSYGRRTGERWRATGTSIARCFASTTASDVASRMIDAALRTFALFESSLRARLEP
jgi:heme oxygenase